MAHSLCTITVSRRPFMWAQAAENVLRQTHRPVLALLAIHGDYKGWDAFTKPIHSAGIPVSVVFVDASKSAGELTNEATTQAAELAPQSLICKMDDDDWYGESYLSAMADAWQAHPDAWILGKSAYTVRYVGGVKDGRIETDAGRIMDEQGHASALAGSTFCIPAQWWLRFDNFRYPNIGLGCDGALMQKADWILKNIGLTPPPFYHVEAGEFYLQRHLNPWHGHHWQRPEDYA